MDIDKYGKYGYERSTQHGRIWPNSKNSKRSRFVARFQIYDSVKDQIKIINKCFPTRLSARKWLELKENLR